MRKRMMFLVYLAMQIIAIFTMAFVFTWVNDKMNASGIFGDYRGEKTDFSPDGYHWGARHYYYFWCCTLLGFLSVVRIIMWGDWYWTDEKDRM